MAEVEKKTENLVYAKPKLITDNVMHYCPGCTLKTLSRFVLRCPVLSTNRLFYSIINHRYFAAE